MKIDKIPKDYPCYNCDRALLYHETYHSLKSGKIVKVEGMPKEFNVDCKQFEIDPVDEKLTQ